MIKKQKPTFNLTIFVRSAGTERNNKFKGNEITMSNFILLFMIYLFSSDYKKP